MTRRSTSTGFSLIELVATLMVLAVLLALAVPVFSDFIRRNAVATQTNELLGALRLARSTAITRGTFVSICPTTTASDATPTCASSTVYNTGWLVYTSKGTGLAFTSGDTLLQVNQTISNASIQGSAPTQVATFDGRGMSTKGALNFLVCAKASSDTVGRSGTRYAGRSVDVQTGGRAGSKPLQTSDTQAAAQGFCTAAS